MSTAIQTFTSAVNNARFNPAGIQRAMVELLRNMTNGTVELVDPTNPVAQVLEAAAASTASFMVADQTLNRLQYPYSAQTVEDLYPHMSDKDYADRFAVPSNAVIHLLFEKEELYDRLVLDTNTGIRKVVIPRNTYVTIGEMVFSLQYPIEIRQMAHGGLQMVYDVSQTSPLQTLSSNLVNWRIITNESGVEMVALEMPMQQFFVLSRSAPINAATGFSLAFDLSDRFYYCRVWVDNADGTFTEMATTHTDATYDIRVPTAVLKVTGQILTVKIPQVYMSTGLADKSVRIDIYQTKGPLVVDLANYTNDQYVISYEAFNPAEKNEFVAPLRAMRTNYVFSTSITSGGANEMSFDELRGRVVRNAMGAPSLPVTNVQIESVLERAGYTVVKNIDNITNRVFLATRSMPEPVDSELITAAGAGIGMLNTSVTQATALSSVADNGVLVTIKPDTLYRYRNGILEFVASAEAAMLKALPPEQQALAVTEGNYFYSPFHYVMDTSNNAFSLRPYYLDKPQVTAKSFVGENDTTLYQVSTDTYVLERTAEGYRLVVQTVSSDEWKVLQDSEVFVQLAFLPPGDKDRAYQLGTLIGRSDTNERVYAFTLSTTYAIDAAHEMVLTDFLMYDDTPRETEIALNPIFDILYSTNVAMGPQWQLHAIDTRLGVFQLPPDTRAITQEQLFVQLGHHLEHLWARTRSVVSESQYERWAVDVPAIYERDVLQTDPVTGAAFEVINGELVYNYLHRAGDPVLDGDGNPVMRFRVGDIKLDAYGAPIVTQGRDLSRQMDLMLVEGTYYFATNQVSIDYRQAMVDTVVDWLTEDLPTMGDSLLEQTKIYYYPTTTLGNVDVMFSSGLTTTLNAGQSFHVTLYVSGKVYSNAELRTAITRKTIEIIGDELGKRTISMSTINDALRAQYGEDVISLEIRGLGGASNLNVVTMTDDASRLSIRKKLVARNDSTLALDESVEIVWVRHERQDTVVR